MNDSNMNQEQSLLLLDQAGFSIGEWNWGIETGFCTRTQSCQSESKQPLRVTTQVLNGGLRTGVQVVRLQTPRVETEIVLSRGGGISFLAFDGRSVGWKSPVPGPVHPSFVPLYRPDGLGWLAGFDEVLARCGLLNVGGPQFNERNQLIHPLHGDIAYWPCQHARASVDPVNRRLILSTSVEIVLFHFHRLVLDTQTMVELDEPKIEVRDTIRNAGGRPCGVMLLHHWNFGPPLASTASRLKIAAREVAPRNSHAARAIGHWDLLDPPRRGAEETVYFLNPMGDANHRGTAVVVDSDRQFGLQMTWDLKTMPYLTIWKNPVATEDGYALGIEPGTCYPNGRPHEATAGRVHELQPGQSLPVTVALTGLTQLAAIESAERSIRECQAATTAIIHADPQSKFGPITS
ncbi:MAG: DUF4432 family protein [Planctomycetaceae bacterium]|nr:DUF4432 family protein [Planctomycetaceae bacterium]